ncbi:MAG TPA: hypothetical protein VK574_13465 [Terracidiphilus sp.]|jgi:hypothetical protein|nr:hypothetical protein [Terracidiphilus sp.]
MPSRGEPVCRKNPERESVKTARERMSEISIPWSPGVVNDERELNLSPLGLLAVTSQSGCEVDWEKFRKGHVGADLVDLLRVCEFVTVCGETV